MRWLLAFAFLAPLGCAGGGEDSRFLEESYVGRVVKDELNELVVTRVDKGTEVVVEFFECDGEQCAEAYVIGAIETPFGDIEGEDSSDATDVEDLIIDGPDVEGKLIYNSRKIGVKGEFRHGRRKLHADIKIIGEVDLRRSDGANDEEDDESEPVS